jgi:hypothetical protein
MKGIFENKWVKRAGLVLLCAALVYALIYADVYLRARSAYLEGEKYYSWYLNPAEKNKALAEELAKEKAKLDGKLASGKMAKDEYAQQLEIIQFDNEQKLKESSIKYAYIWYQTVVELFSPPETKYVKLAREKMPKAKELWKKELTDKGVPFEDYMLE